MFGFGNKSKMSATIARTAMDRAVKSINEAYRSKIAAFINGGSFSRVDATKAMDYYSKAVPLADAVDMITKKSIAITPMVDDKPVELLMFPNKGSDYSSFMTQLLNSFQLTGNAFVMALGNVNSKPSSIYVVPPQYVTVSDSGVYQVNTTNLLTFMSGSYILDPITGRILASGAMANLKELLHIKSFKTYRTSQMLSDSPLEAIQLDLEIILNGCAHNLSLLKNGASIGSIVNFKGADKETIDSAKKSWLQKFIGAANAGTPVFSNAEDVSINPIGMNNKDLEIIESLKTASKNVYTRFEIPAPLIEGDSQTYNNYSTAQVALYDNAVMPLLNIVLDDLSRFFMMRRVISKPMEIDQSTIPSLQVRFAEVIKLKKDIGVFSPNELRAEFGIEGVEGGDDVLVPLNLQPLGQPIEGDE